MIERLIKTVKNECIRRILVPFRQDAFRRMVAHYLQWYNEHRPHETLGGKTPNEVYFGRSPAHERPRIEPRAKWPQNLGCAAPQVPVSGRPGQPFDLHVRHRHGRMPVVKLTLHRQAAV